MKKIEVDTRVLAIKGNKIVLQDIENLKITRFKMDGLKDHDIKLGDEIKLIYYVNEPIKPKINKNE